MICPVLYGKLENGECVEGKCAIWHPKAKVCAILNMCNVSSDDFLDAYELAKRTLDQMCKKCHKPLSAYLGMDNAVLGNIPPERIP